MEPLIKTQNLNFTYNAGKDNEYQALININLEIYPEELIVVFGPSGCGKSTLLNLIAGLERPEANTMYILGKDMHSMTKNDFAMYHRTQIGMIYQQYNLITSLTVLENVALPQVFINVNKGKRNTWSRSLLERFGILKQAKKIPSELSGGQQQRIGIARSIVNNPDIILADEPVGNLDSVSAKNVLTILEKLNEKEKKTVILVTHNPEFLVYGDRLFYMKDGVITREVINKDRKKRERAKVLPKSTASEINDLMRAYHGLTPEQINILIMPYKAKAFAHHFVSSRSMEETKILEDVIQRRLLGTISQEDFFEILKKSITEGGVGFDVRTAEKILRRVNRIIRTAYYIYQNERVQEDDNGKNIKISDIEKAKKVTWYLLNSCYFKHYKNLEGAQMNRLQESVKERLVGILQKDNFFEKIDKPFKDGGVGLNVKTAKAMAEELELILILGFGVVQKTSIEEKNKKIEKNKAETNDINKHNEFDNKNLISQEALSAVTENITAQVATDDGNSAKSEQSEAMTLSGEEVVKLAESGFAFDDKDKKKAKPSTADLLEKELKNTEELTRQSKENLKDIPKIKNENNE
ncbi:MAG: ABC transporter ATP-binding protein [Patescibacteria group bacterium]|nr:ABC transporter ATP-binding protein [Patescibacteria group bacterium]